MAVPGTVEDWERLREAVRTRLAGQLASRFPTIRLDPIDPEACRAAADWTGRRVAHWDWASIVRSRGRSRLDVAIWMGPDLSGLAAGTGGVDRIEIDFMEGAPGPGAPLRGHVANIVIALAELQAHAIGAREVRLVRPLPNLLDWYAERGFRERVFSGFEVEYLVRRL